jgi:hypothetical protein
MSNDASVPIADLAAVTVADQHEAQYHAFADSEVSAPSVSVPSCHDSTVERRSRGGYRYPPLEAFSTALGAVEEETGVTVDRSLPRTWFVSGTAVKTLAGYAEACTCDQPHRHTPGGPFHDRVYLIQSRDEGRRYALVTTSREAVADDETLLVTGETGLRIVSDEGRMDNDEEIVTRRLDTDRLIELAAGEVPRHE